MMMKTKTKKMVATTHEARLVRLDGGLSGLVIVMILMKGSKFN